MKILLLKHVKGIGQEGEVKEVKEGYAMNFLIPQKLAVPATKKVIEGQERDKANKVAAKEVKHSLLLGEFEKIEGKTIELQKQVNSSGGLFGAIHEKEIEEAINSQLKVHIPLQYIHTEPIKETGEFAIKVGDKGGTQITLKLVVKGQ